MMLFAAIAAWKCALKLSDVFGENYHNKLKLNSTNSFESDSFVVAFVMEIMLEIMEKMFSLDCLRQLEPKI